MLNNNDVWIVKYKSLGWPSAKIAKKFGGEWTAKDVDERWAAIQMEAQACTANGYGALVDKFTVMANQYQLLGDTMKYIGMALGNTISSEELKKLIVPGDTDATVKSLLEHCIILRPFFAFPSPPAQVVAEPPADLSGN